MLQFRGVHAPAELFHLVSNGEITEELAWLTLIIDAYVNCKGEGCFASNKTLADHLHKTPRQIQKMILILRGYRKIDGVTKKVGPQLIRVTGGKKLPNGGKLRILETKWSRIDLTPQDEDWGTEESTPAPPRPKGHPLNKTPASEMPLPPVSEMTPNNTVELDNKEEDIIPNGRGLRLPTEDSQKTSMKGSLKMGFISTIKTGKKDKAPAFGEREIDWIRSISYKYRKDLRISELPKTDFMMFGRHLKKTAESMEDGPKRIDAFIKALENGDANFVIGHARTFHKCFIEWESRQCRIEWKRKDGEGKVIWNQSTPPTMEQLGQYDWFPYRGRKPVPREEARLMRLAIIEREEQNA